MEQPNSEITVKFNKKQCALTKEQAADYAQKGIKYEQLLPEITRLQLLAEQNGQPLGELVGELVGDRVDEQQLQQRLSHEQQLARALEELQQVYPDIDSTAALPERAAQIMEQRGISPLDAMLRYENEQQQRAQRVQAAAREASESSAGQLHSGESEQLEGELSALLRGIRG